MRNTNDLNRTSSFSPAAAWGLKRPATLKFQRGILLAEAMMYLALTAILAVYASSLAVKQIEDHGMESTAVYMTILKTGLEKYNATNRDELAAGLTVLQPACGAMPRTGAPIANSLAPTIAELVAGRCIAAIGFPSTTPQKQTVATKIELQGCPGVACRLFATAYTTTPLQTRGNPRYDLVATYLQASKGSGAASQSGDEGFLRSPYMRTANPVLGPSGTPAGAVLAIGTYFDEGIYANFVKLNDVRPINLNNTLTVAGDITGRNNVGTSDGVGACFRAALTNGGQVIARAADCLARVVLDGNTGNLLSFDATGRNAAGISYAGNVSTVYADNLRNNNNNAGIRADGTLFGATANITGNMTAGSVTSNGPLQVNGNATVTGQITGGSITNAAGTAGIDAGGNVTGLNGNFNSIVINNTAFPGQPCAPANAAVWGNVGGADVLMRCTGGVWTPAGGAALGVAGAACPTNGAAGVSAAGVSLICSNGTWISTTERMGKWVVMASYTVAHGTAVDKPVCSGGGQAAIYAIPQKIDSQWLFTNFYADSISTLQWQVNIVNGQTPATGLADARAIAQTGCWFL